jgi:hypothetical protein
MYCKFFEDKQLRGSEEEEACEPDTNELVVDYRHRVGGWA